MISRPVVLLSSIFKVQHFSSVLRIQSLRPVSSNLSSKTVNEVPPDAPANTENPKNDEASNLQQEIQRLSDVQKELEDKYKRALAESENMRKRLVRQIDEAKLFGIQSFCKDLLDVADVLTKATETISAEQLEPGVNPHFANLFEGLKMTESQMLQVFERHHLVRIQPAEGDQFDPNIHEAVFQAPLQSGKKPNTVAVMTKVGYKLYDRTLRPAYVGVFGPQ